MSALLRAMNVNITLTENGMPTLDSSMDALVDLFYKWGGSRGKFNDLKPYVHKAFAEDYDKCVRLLLWGRDVRGGAGERELLRKAVLEIADYLTTTQARAFISKTVEVGRWDDVLVWLDTKHFEAALYWIALALRNEDGLCAKWMPREKNNPKVAKTIQSYMALTPRQYRKMLVRLTNVVESQMCDNRWKEIKYGHVPSVAAARYQKAFSKHDEAGYKAYREGLVNGTEKINASAVYPYDVVKSLWAGKADVANAQWKSLPNYLADDYSNTLVVADVSGSMMGGSPSPLEVCISLALYLSERNKGIFRDCFLTFSHNPTIQKVSGTLHQRFNQIRTADWGMSTNLEKTFQVILNSAIKGEVPPEEMPSQIVILSDMQFNQCVAKKEDNVFQMANRMYEKAGYNLPKIVFWNLRTSNGVPVSYDQRGTALVSGFSPSIMKSILSQEMLDPSTTMLRTIMDERYDWQ